MKLNELREEMRKRAYDKPATKQKLLNPNPNRSRKRKFEEMMDDSEEKDDNLDSNYEQQHKKTKTQ